MRRVPRRRETAGVALLDTFDRLNRKLVEAPALLRFVEQERDAALRILTMDGVPQRRMVGGHSRLIDDEVRSGTYEPPVEPATLAYAIVKLAEAFLFNDAAAGMRGDVDRLRDVEAALLRRQVDATTFELPLRAPGWWLDRRSAAAEGRPPARPPRRTHSRGERRALP